LPSSAVFRSPGPRDSGSFAVSDVLRSSHSLASSSAGRATGGGATWIPITGAAAGVLIAALVAWFVVARRRRSAPPAASEDEPTVSFSERPGEELECENPLMSEDEPFASSEDSPEVNDDADEAAPPFISSNKRL
jgi:hypothetical protein